MPYRTSTGRFLLRWWPLPLAIAMAVYAALVPEPYALGGSTAEVSAFGVAALALVASCVYPSRNLRLTALWWVTVIAVARTIVLVTNPPVVDAQRTAAGVTIWLTFAYLVTVLTIISELAAGTRSQEPWSS